MSTSSGSHKDLRRQVEALREKVQRLTGSRALNEETTKASLIIPLLSVLGWDSANPEEVQYEYRRRPKDNPVDFALMLQRTPCLFVEAKAMGENLTDRRWTNQVISYSTQSGVAWVVLTNGVDYHIYNAHAPVPLEGKLFKTLSIAETPLNDLVHGLSLLSKTDFVGKRIDRVWDAHHIDSQVQATLKRLFSEEECDALARLISRQSSGTLSRAAVRESLLRADIRVEFPPAPVEAPRKSGKPKKPDRGAAREQRSPQRSDVNPTDLFSAGLLKAPVQLVTEYRGHRLTATLLADGNVEMDGRQYPSLSTAAGMARLPHFEGDLKGRTFPQTNGWIFWNVLDPETGELVPVDVIRQRFASR